MRSFFIFIIKLYQLFLSPVARFLGAECRFYPSCSEYAMEAFGSLPWWRAVRLTIGRLAKCGPWNEGGINKV